MAQRGRPREPALTEGQKTRIEDLFDRVCEAEQGVTKESLAERTQIKGPRGNLISAQWISNQFRADERRPLLLDNAARLYLILKGACQSAQGRKIVAQIAREFPAVKEPTRFCRITGFRTIAFERVAPAAIIDPYDHETFAIKLAKEILRKTLPRLDREIYISGIIQKYLEKNARAMTQMGAMMFLDDFLAEPNYSGSSDAIVSFLHDGLREKRTREIFGIETQRR